MSDMTIHGINSYAAATPATTAADNQTAASEKAAESTKAADEGVVFEKSTETAKDSTKQIYSKEALTKSRDSIVARLKADQQARIDSMQSLVHQLLGKQVGTSLGLPKQSDIFDLSNLSDNEIGSLHLADTFRSAAANASADDIAAAQQSISEDGYWGVNQTSDRLVSMAIALSGGDTGKADEMMNAIQKGFDKATAAWGEDLPQISQDTLKATMEKMENWKNGLTTAEDYSRYLS